jgi:hypothetical protein
VSRPLARTTPRPATWFVAAGIAIAMLVSAACAAGARPTPLAITTPTVESSPAAPVVPPSDAPSASTPATETAATATVSEASVQPTEAAPPPAIATETPIVSPQPPSAAPPVVTPFQRPGAAKTPRPGIRRPPVATPLVQQTTSGSRLPMLTVLLGTGAASYYQQFAGPGDIGIVPAQKLNYFNNEAALIPSKTIAGGFSSWEAGQQLLDSLQGRVSYIAYDAEHWPQTPVTEQQNLVATVQNMSQVLHSRGIELILVPDRRFDQQYMSQLAPYADIVVLQGQRIQANPQDFHDQLQPLITAAKSANPNVKVFASVGTNNGATSASMRAALDTLRDSIDGISVFSFGDQNSLNTLQQFVSDTRK